MKNLLNTAIAMVALAVSLPAAAQISDDVVKKGLGYPEGMIALLERTGLAHHQGVTLALFQALGNDAYAPARRAQVEKQSATGGKQ